MNSKGVTPVVATVLLITISVAATGAAYTYIVNAQDSAAENFQDQLNDEQLKQNSDLNIEHIYEGGGGNALLLVRNTGDIDQHIESEDNLKYWTLYIDGEPVGSSGTGWNYLSGTTAPVRLSPDQTITIDSTETFPSSGQKEFKLVGRYGSTDTYICFSDGGSSC